MAQIVAWSVLYRDDTIRIAPRRGSNPFYLPLKGVLMQRITIGRYNPIPEDVPRPADPSFQPVQDSYAGWVEGVRDDGSSWIMWLDRDGSPDVFWGQRDDGGGVIGQPVVLGRDDIPVLKSDSTVTPV